MFPSYFHIFIVCHFTWSFWLSVFWRYMKIIAVSHVLSISVPFELLTLDSSIETHLCLLFIHTNADEFENASLSALIVLNRRFPSQKTSFESTCCRLESVSWGGFSYFVLHYTGVSVSLFLLLDDPIRLKRDVSCSSPGMIFFLYNCIILIMLLQQKVICKGPL